MQLLKITTTPIKYRFESEMASITPADPDTQKSSPQILQTPVAQTSMTGWNTEPQKEAISADNQKFRTDVSINSKIPKPTKDDYSVKYRYGQDKSAGQLEKTIKSSDLHNKSFSLDSMYRQMKSIKPNKSWEPEKNTGELVEYNNDIRSPEFEFSPATWRLIVEEFAEVKIEYLGGFNYIPKSASPDYEETEDK